MNKASHCVILAAGRNTRLDKGIPKSLTTLTDETILERHIRIFSNLGIKEFCVVGGYEFDKLNLALSRLSDQYGIEISVHRNDDLSKENGYSVMQVKSWVEEKKIDHFLLTMGDHIFQSELVTSFLEKIDKRNGSLYLATDRPGESNQHIDLEDVTKVKTSANEEILAIGKQLKDFDRYDTGLFLFHKSIFQELSENFGKGKYGISDLVRELSQKKRAKSIDVTGFNWNDIDNEQDLQNSLAMIQEGRL